MLGKCWVAPGMGQRLRFHPSPPASLLGTTRLEHQNDTFQILLPLSSGRLVIRIRTEAVLPPLGLLLGS